MISARKKPSLLAVVLLGLLIGPGWGLTHKVKKGETFYAIARKHDVSVASLMSHNGYSDPGSLQVGKSLKIPGKTSKVAIRAASLKAKPKSLRVIIDPGHGGRDRGAVWGGVRESDLNLKVALRVEKLLKSRGYSVTMTRRSDVFVGLDQRAGIANRYRDAVFVSIHFNASKYTSVRGAETFYLGKKGRYLATSVQNHLVSGLSVRNRGCQYRKYAVLSQTACPAVLVECGFISNPGERSRCQTAWYQANAAKAIVDGIERYDRRY